MSRPHGQKGGYFFWVQRALRNLGERCVRCGNLPDEGWENPFAAEPDWQRECYGDHIWKQAWPDVVTGFRASPTQCQICGDDPNHARQTREKWAAEAEHIRREARRNAELRTATEERRLEIEADRRFEAHKRVVARADDPNSGWNPCNNERANRHLPPRGSDAETKALFAEAARRRSPEVALAEKEDDILPTQIRNDKILKWHKR